MMIENPFLISGYLSPEYFCDREQETKRMIGACANGRNQVLFADRRIGKTGLIQHVFYMMSKKRNTATIYFDILGTSNLRDFVNAFGAAVIGKLDSKAMRFVQKATSLITALRPKISFDGLTGEPEVTIDVGNEKEAIHSLEEIFKYLELRSGSIKIVVAIDEFQQVREYPEKNMEAILRSKIQFLNNVSFIFSGSRKHLLMEMFGDARRPFYQSADFMELKNIDPKEYSIFIKSHLKKQRKQISDDDILYILEWTRNVTFYVQSVCNKLFYREEKVLSREVINMAFYELLCEHEQGFYNIRSLLSKQQWNLLHAIAKDDGVNEPSGFDFMHRHKVGAGSTVRTALKALIQKELVLKDKEKFHVYDVFFSRWLQRL